MQILALVLFYFVWAVFFVCFPCQLVNFAFYSYFCRETPTHDKKEWKKGKKIRVEWLFWIFSHQWDIDFSIVIPVEWWVCTSHNWLVFNFWSQAARKQFLVNPLISSWIVHFWLDRGEISWGAGKLARTPCPLPVGSLIGLKFSHVHVGPIRWEVSSESISHCLDPLYIRWLIST